MAFLHLLAAVALTQGAVPPLAWRDAKVGAVAAFASYPSVDVAEVVTLMTAKDAHGAQLVVARDVYGGYNSGVEVVSRDCLDKSGSVCPPVEQNLPTRFLVPLETRWATSADCPAITDILAQIRAFPAPPPSPPGWNTYPRGVDGTDYNLWAAGNSANAASIEVAGWSDAPVAAFVDNALGRLRSCWRSAKPKSLGQ